MGESTTKLILSRTRQPLLSSTLRSIPGPLPLSWQGRCACARRPRSAIDAPAAADIRTRPRNHLRLEAESPHPWPGEGRALAAGWRGGALSGSPIQIGFTLPGCTSPSVAFPPSSVHPCQSRHRGGGGRGTCSIPRAPSRRDWLSSPST